MCCSDKVVARLSMCGRSLCRASLVFRVRVGLGFCVRVRVSITGSVSYLNENCSLHTLLLSVPAIHQQSSPKLHFSVYQNSTFSLVVL